MPRAPALALVLLAALGAVLGAALGVALGAAPVAAQERYSRVEEWLLALGTAGAAADYGSARDVVLSAGEGGFPEEVRKALAAQIARAFKGRPFAVETVTRAPTERDWERRVVALIGNGRYLYVAVLLHRRDGAWVTAHFRADTDFAAVAEGF